MRSLALPALALVAAAFACFVLLKNQGAPVATTPLLAPPVADFPVTVAAVGLIEASSENVAIGTPVAGIVDRVFVQVNDAVVTGAPLFGLDHRHLTAELGVRRAGVITAMAGERSAQATFDDENDQLRRAENLTKGNVISADELVRRQFAVRAAEARLEVARAELVTAQAQLHAVETEIERCTIRAPLDGAILQLNVRPGQFAPASQSAQPLIILGRTRPLHIRVDVDEHEAWKVRPEAAAIAHVRGNADLKFPLKFVRFEPLVIPKRSLTGESIERVDTRVLQVIYEIAKDDIPLFVGQQMDVFIDQQHAKSPAGL